MINATFDFECDCCGRKGKVIFTQIVSCPDLKALLQSNGWDRFLAGPTLCPECVQNAEHLERVQRVVTSAAKQNTPSPNMVTGSHRKTDEEVLNAIRAAGGNKSSAARNMGISISGMMVRCRNIRAKNGGTLPVNGEASVS